MLPGCLLLSPVRDQARCSSLSSHIADGGLRPFEEVLPFSAVGVVLPFVIMITIFVFPSLLLLIVFHRAPPSAAGAWSSPPPHCSKRVRHAARFRPCAGSARRKGDFARAERTLGLSPAAPVIDAGGTQPESESAPKTDGAPDAEGTGAAADREGCVSPRLATPTKTLLSSYSSSLHRVPDG